MKVRILENGKELDVYDDVAKAFSKSSEFAQNMEETGWEVEGSDVRRVKTVTGIAVKAGTYYPKDGEPFAACLLTFLNNAYLMAEKI